MQRVLETMSSTYVGRGRVAHKAVSPLVRLVRHMANPDIPNDHMVTKAAYRGRTFNLEHRRWSGGRPARYPAMFHRCPV